MVFAVVIASSIDIRQRYAASALSCTGEQRNMNSFNKSLDLIFKNRIANHVLFWGLSTLTLAYHGSLFGGEFNANLINLTTLLPAQMAAAYLLVYFQIPRWAYKGEWIKFVISFLGIAYVLSVIARLSIIYIAQPIIGIDGIDETLGEILSDPLFLIKVFMVSVYLPAILLFLIKMTKDRFVQQNRVVRLEKEKRTAELNFLKAQMNPHFLFNTLNNIYGLAKGKSEQTPEMILKLSEILDYTIYECKEDRVPVIREWELIENYADLETLRYTDQLTIVLNQSIDNPQTAIAPLILIALVENAFKYALKEKNEKPSIRLTLKLKEQQLSFELFNTKAIEGKNTGENKKGIGVENVRQQLALQYPDRHELKVSEKPESYQVNLSIQL